MKLVYLNREGKYAQVDDADYEYCSQFRWYYHTAGYATRMEYLGRTNGKENTKQILLHRDLLQPDKGIEVDHVDGNGLNNQRANLRLATHAENMRNRRKQKNNTSGYIGVHFDKSRGKYSAHVQINGRLVHLGRYPTLEEAVKARDEYVPRVHGEFARLNTSNAG